LALSALWAGGQAVVAWAVSALQPGAAEDAVMGGLSLSANGLRLADGNLTCPKGGSHDVRDVDVMGAKARGGGTVICLSCGTKLKLVPV
jgi:hypothetical protein